MFNDTTKLDTNTTAWIEGDSPLKVSRFVVGTSGNRVARDYEFRILDKGADTSAINNKRSNFQIWDVTDPENTFKMRFFYQADHSEPGVLDHKDKVTIMNRGMGNRFLWEANFEFPPNVDSSLWVAPEKGDVLKVVTRKSFDRHDAFEFTLIGNSLDNTKAKNELDNIYVVPDPYIAVNRLERKIFNPEEGRGGRRIDFVNLPKECSISIFTVSGKFVQKIVHVASEANRRASWDLRTKDGLEIAHGVYFYAVEAPGIGVKTGKFAVIK
jgi:hypothetical protein